MKSARQIAILEMISEQAIETQEELADQLRDRGFNATQATVSRDIRELRLVKVLTPEGSYRYASVDRNENSLSERLIRMFTETVLSMSAAYNQIVIKTLSGSANTAGAMIDNLRWPEVLGTIAGDDTILLIVRSIDEVKPVMERLNALRHRAER